MRSRPRSPFLEKAKTHLCDCNHAHSDARRFLTGGDEFNPAALPAVPDRPSPAQIARARAFPANGSRRLPEPVANADNSPAMEFEADLPKPGRTRLLRTVGKRTRGGAADESDLTDSVRDFGSMPPAQTTMGGRATYERAANKLQGRTGASSAIAAFASDNPSETAQFNRCGAAAFSYRVRRFALFSYCACRAGERPFAAFGSTHEARTGNRATCLRRAE